MDLEIDSSSVVPIRRQLTEQIVFMIAVERIKSGEQMPSVRALARRLKIHHNTVSEAYSDLVAQGWLGRRRGSRLTALSRGAEEAGAAPDDLDDLINRTIASAREHGYSLQALRARVRQRLLVEAPDHLLVVEQDEGLRNLLCEELRQALPWNVNGCSRAALDSTPGLAIGALAVVPAHAAAAVAGLLPKLRPVVPIRYAHADEPLKKIRALKKPSVIAVMSSSKRFLEAARGVLAPAIGNRHEISEILVREKRDCAAAQSADLVFCDSTVPLPKRRSGLTKAIRYRLVSPESIAQVDAAMKAYRENLDTVVLAGHV